MKSIIDDVLSVHSYSEAEFEIIWASWLQNKNAYGYVKSLEQDYDVFNLSSLPIPQINFQNDGGGAKERDEVLAEYLEGSVLMDMVRNGKFKEVNETNFEVNGVKLSLSQIYAAYLMEVARLWRHAFSQINKHYGMARRIWYKGFKVFAQKLRGNNFSESDNGNLTNALKKWVSTGVFRYSDVYVQDRTRKIFRNDSIYGWKNVFLCVEKDAAADELIELAELVGANYVISGHGAPGFAATEKAVLLDLLKGRTKEAVQDFVRNNPNEKTIVLAIVSDYDHAGYNAVAGGFIKQFKLICSIYGLEIKYKRVGLMPSHVPIRRLKPSFALYSPPLRAAIRCNKCKKTQYICNYCGKIVKTANGKPKSCNNKDRDGNNCDGDEFTKLRIQTKVKAQTRNGFLRKSDRDDIIRDNDMKFKFINKIACSNCDNKDQDISIESNPWMSVYGVPFCETHDTCHTINKDEFSDRSKFKQDNTCFIIRYGIELDALGASYYYNDIVEFILDALGIKKMSDWCRQEYTPDDYEYQNTLESLAKEYIKDDYEYIELNNKIDSLRAEIDSLRQEKEDMIEPIKNSLWEHAEPIVKDNSWDDRQRTWIESENENEDGSWSESSIKDMHQNHIDTIKGSIKRKSRFISYWMGLDFRKSILQDKLENLVKEEIDAGNIEIDVDTEEEADDFAVLMIEKKYKGLDGFNLMNLVDKILENVVLSETIDMDRADMEIVDRIMSADNNEESEDEF